MLFLLWVLAPSMRKCNYNEDYQTMQAATQASIVVGLCTCMSHSGSYIDTQFQCTPCTIINQGIMDFGICLKKIPWALLVSCVWADEQVVTWLQANTTAMKFKCNLYNGSTLGHTAVLISYKMTWQWDYRDITFHNHGFHVSQCGLS